MAKKSRGPRNTLQVAKSQSGCPTRKIRYADKFDAMDGALAASMSYGHSMRTYECDKCEGWHLTSIDREWMSSADFRRSQRDGSAMAEKRDDGATSAEVPPTAS